MGSMKIMESSFPVPAAGAEAKNPQGASSWHPIIPYLDPETVPQVMPLGEASVPEPMKTISSPTVLAAPVVFSFPAAKPPVAAYFTLQELLLDWRWKVKDRVPSGSRISNQARVPARTL